MDREEATMWSDIAALLREIGYSSFDQLDDAIKEHQRDVLFAEDAFAKAEKRANGSPQREAELAKARVQLQLAEQHLDTLVAYRSAIQKRLQ